MWPVDVVVAQGETVSVHIDEIAEGRGARFSFKTRYVIRKVT